MRHTARTLLILLVCLTPACASVSGSALMRAQTGMQIATATFEAVDDAEQAAFQAGLLDQSQHLEADEAIFNFGELVLTYIEIVEAWTEGSAEAETREPVARAQLFSFTDTLNSLVPDTVRPVLTVFRSFFGDE